MRSILTATAVLALAACGSADETASDTSAATLNPGATLDSAAIGQATAGGATAVLRDSAGRELGTVTLADASGGIAVSGTLRGVAPGTYGFHLHTVGDMPNVTAGADSTVAIQATTPGGTLRGENALLDADGAAVMLHAGTDDYRSDPTGDAGGRMACGVVQG